jgi:hypothetical protein
MIHRDGTIIARYPKDDKLIGLNVANTPAFQRALALDGTYPGASPARGCRKTRSARSSR